MEHDSGQRGRNTWNTERWRRYRGEEEYPGVRKSAGSPLQPVVFLVFLLFLRLLRFLPEKHYRYRKHLVGRLNAQIGGCGAVDALGAFTAGDERVVYAVIEGHDSFLVRVQLRFGGGDLQPWLRKSVNANRDRPRHLIADA